MCYAHPMSQNENPDQIFETDIFDPEIAAYFSGDLETYPEFAPEFEPDEPYMSASDLDWWDVEFENRNYF